MRQLPLSFVVIACKILEAGSMASTKNDVTHRNWRHLVCFYNYDQKAESRDTSQNLGNPEIGAENIVQNAGRVCIANFRIPILAV